MYTKSNGRLQNALIKNNVINRIPIIVHKIEIIFAHVTPWLYLLGEKSNTETVQVRTTYTLITIDSTCCVCGKKITYQANRNQQYYVNSNPYKPFASIFHWPSPLTYSQGQFYTSATVPIIPTM